MEVLFTFLAERYERRSVMITSNLVFSQWDRIFKDPMTTAAAIDRLVHHAIILELTGPSIRRTTRVCVTAKETRAHVDATAKETRDHFNAVIESVDHPIRMIADGHMMPAEKVDDLAERMAGVERRVDRLGTEVVALRTQVQVGDEGLHEELAAFRSEVRGKFAEVRRVARLESTVGDLAARVGRLEGHAAT